MTMNPLHATEPPTPELIPVPSRPELPPVPPGGPGMVPLPDLSPEAPPPVPEEVPPPDAPDTGQPPPEEQPLLNRAALAMVAVAGSRSPFGLMLAGALLVVAIGGAAGGSHDVLAQAETAPLPERTPPEIIHKDPAQPPSDEVPPNDRAAEPETPLSEHLEHSEGVITPPDAHGTDPGMVQPAPETTSAMPVIPPPGSPGGDPAVRPQ